jgi:hypothetical protein
MEESICHVPEEGRSDDVWWLGFDTGHAFDYQPGMAAYEAKRFRHTAGETYRTLQYVTDEVLRLAEQAAEANTSTTSNT